MHLHGQDFLHLAGMFHSFDTYLVSNPNRPGLFIAVEMNTQMYES